METQLAFNSTARFATDEDIPAILHVLHANDMLSEDLDWSDLGNHDMGRNGHWLVIESHNKIVGTVNVLLGKPLGTMQFLAILPEYWMGGAGPNLVWFAERLLKANSIQGYSGTVSNPKVLVGLERFGCTASETPVIEFTKVI